MRASKVPNHWWSANLGNFQLRMANIFVFEMSDHSPSATFIECGRVRLCDGRLLLLICRKRNWIQVGTHTDLPDYIAPTLNIYTYIKDWRTQKLNVYNVRQTRNLRFSLNSEVDSGCDRVLVIFKFLLSILFLFFFSPARFQLEAFDRSRNPELFFIDRCDCVFAENYSSSSTEAARIGS